jgi:hypothetical protein
LVGNPEGNRSLEIPSPKWEDNIKINLKEIGWKRVDWINLAHDRNKWQAHLKAVMKRRDSIECVKFLE